MAVGRRILGKPEDEGDARQDARADERGARTASTPASRSWRPDARRSWDASVETRLHFKPLTPVEIDGFIAGGEWRGKAAGYAIQGAPARGRLIVTAISGSFTGVVGLPLYETRMLLQGLGFPAP